MFFHCYKKNIIKNVHKYIKLQMFNRYFFAIIHAIITQIIKNKNLPFVKTKKPECTECSLQIKNSWTQFAHEK